jgi:hypothetical protein
MKYGQARLSPAQDDDNPGQERAILPRIDSLLTVNG